MELTISLLFKPDLMAAVAESQEDLGISFFEAVFPDVSCSSLAFVSF